MLQNNSPATRLLHIWAGYAKYPHHPKPPDQAQRETPGRVNPARYLKRQPDPVYFPAMSGVVAILRLWVVSSVSPHPQRHEVPSRIIPSTMCRPRPEGWSPNSEDPSTPVHHKNGHHSPWRFRNPLG